MSVLSLRTNADVSQEVTPRSTTNETALLETLWQRHARQVYTLALRLLTDVNKAEAITAEVFQRAFQGVPHQAGEERQFLLALTIERSLAWLRKQQRLFVPDKSDDPVEATAPSSYPVDLETHLLRLPDYWRVVFVLHDVMGLRHEEIATYLRTEEADVRRVVHRARLALRNALHERKQDG